jgi:acetoacetate decarboxylase
MASLLETKQPSVGAFKINAHLQGYFISLCFHCLAIQCNTVLSSTTKPNFLFSIIPHYAPKILRGFEISHPSKACC